MRGRKPDPTSLKLISGSRNIRDDPEDEPIPAGALAEPPESMTDSQRVIWREAIENAPRGLLRRLDGQLLSIWVVAADMHEKASIEVQKYGMVVTTAKQGVAIQSPYLPIVNRQAEIMLRCASELGFSPTSRSRITLADGGKKDTNRFSNNAARRRG